MVIRMIYLDNAATTAVCKSAYNKMIKLLSDDYANPSAIYSFSSSARREMNLARYSIAKLINAEPVEIYFTSGGTESDNWALRGINNGEKKHIITTSFEHHAIINTCKYLEKKGFDVTYVEPDEFGIVDPDKIRRAIRKNDTFLISVMFANNEIGTIQPIKEIGKIAHDNNIIFHTDAVQAFGHIQIDVKELNIDMLSASSHKCYGPKGTGILYVRQGIKFQPFIYGGSQERKMRAGTENVPAIAGFGAACAEIMSKNNYNQAYILSLRNHFIKRITSEIDYCVINGSQSSRLPGNINVSFAYVDGEALLIQLDLHDIVCSAGSACNAGQKQVSHVIKSIHVPELYSYGTVRFTLDEHNTIEEIDQTVDELKEIIIKLRQMSSEYKTRLKV